MQIIRIDSFSPRVETSTVKSGVNLPPDLFKLIDEVFNKGFSPKFPEYTFHTSGRVYPEELNLNISLKKAKTIIQLNFCASINFDQSKNQTNDEQMDLINVAVDALGSFVEQYLEADGDIEIPREWSEFEFEDKKVYLKFNTNNSDLEAQADAILGIDPLSAAENDLDTSLAGLDLESENEDMTLEQKGLHLEPDFFAAAKERALNHDFDLLVEDREKWKNSLN